MLLCLHSFDLGGSAMERDLSLSPPCEDFAWYYVSTDLEPTQFLTIHTCMLSTSSQCCWISASKCYRLKSSPLILFQYCTSYCFISISGDNKQQFKTWKQQNRAVSSAIFSRMNALGWGSFQSNSFTARAKSVKGLSTSENLQMNFL